MLFKKLFLSLIAILIAPILIFLIGEFFIRIFNPNITPQKMLLFDQVIDRPHPTQNLKSKFRLKTDWTRLKMSDYRQSPSQFVPLERSGDVWQQDSDGYINLKADYTAYHKAVYPQTGEIIYDVKYTQDSFRRRRTIGQTQEASQHLILSGCSSTFGEGINDQQTLSHFLQKRMPDANVFNLGIPGGSVVTALTTMTTRNNWDGIFPKEGILLFSYSTQIHVPRFLGTMKLVGSWYYNGPFLTKNAQNKYEYGGVYYLHKPLRTVMSQLLSQSRLLSAIGFDWPPINETALDEYAQAIHELRIQYRKKYSRQNELVVYLWPGEEDNRAMIPYLEKYQIYYLDYTGFDLTNYAQKNLFIKWDHHPTEEFNRILSEQIASDLEIPENKINLKKSISAE